METIKTKVCAKCGKEKFSRVLQEKWCISRRAIAGSAMNVPPPAKPKRLRVYEGGNPALAGFKPRELMGTSSELVGITVNSK